MTPEDIARKLLADTGVDDPETYSAGELVYIANMVQENIDLKQQVARLQKHAQRDLEDIGRYFNHQKVQVCRKWLGMTS